jgi:soluble lytic murein transglycosylase
LPRHANTRYEECRISAFGEARGFALRFRHRCFVALLAVAAIGAAEARGEALSTADLAAMRAAVAAADAGNWNEAFAAAAPIKDPLPGKILHWLDYARPGAPGGFADIAAFIEANPDWPGQKALREHAEESLAAEPDPVAAAWLKKHPPIGAAG